MLSISYYYFEFQVGFYFLVRRGNLISLSLFNFRAFANVVRSQIYFVTFLVQYYSQEATIIVFEKVSKFKLILYFFPFKKVYLV